MVACAPGRLCRVAVGNALLFAQRLQRGQLVAQLVLLAQLVKVGLDVDPRVVQRLRVGAGRLWSKR